MSPQALPLKIYLRRLIWVCVAPPVVVIALLALALAEQLQAERTGHLKHYAYSLAASLDAELLSRVHGLQTLGSGAPKLDGPESYAQWHRRIGSYDATFNAPVLITNADRQTLIHSREPLGKSLPLVAKPKGRSALTDALLTGKPAVGDRVTGAVLQQLLVAVAVPISGERHDLIAMALIPVNQLTQSMEANPPPAGWEVQLVDSVGQVISPHDESAMPEPSLLERPRHFKVPLAEAPWTVQVRVEFAEFYRSRLILLLLILLGAASTVAGALWGARSLARSLNASIKRMGKDVQQGDARKGISTMRISETLVAEIEAAREEMLRLGLAKNDAQENERRRIARELHDSLQQDLGALRLHLEVINGSQTLTYEALREVCAKASALAHGSIQELDRIVKDLRPWLLEQLGPAAAIEQLAESYRQTTNLQIELEIIGDEAAFEVLPASIASCIFRVTQESLTNVVKHAQASFVHIVLDHSRSGWLCLQVMDEGSGIEPAAHEKPDSRGLRGMAERVMALDGTLEISRGHHEDSNSGTTVNVKIPIKLTAV